MNHLQIQKMSDSGEIVIVDVREKDEWDAGHIAGARHIPLGSLSSATAANMPKDIPIYVYCHSGSRSAMALYVLQELGYGNVLNLGGIYGWVRLGGELVKE